MHDDGRAPTQMDDRRQWHDTRQRSMTEEPGHDGHRGTTMDRARARRTLTADACRCRTTPADASPRRTVAEDGGRRRTTKDEDRRLASFKSLRTRFPTEVVALFRCFLLQQQHHLLNTKAPAPNWRRDRYPSRKRDQRLACFRTFLPKAMDPKGFQ